MSSDLIGQYDVESEDRRLLQATPSNTSDDDERSLEAEDDLRRQLHCERVQHRRQLAFLQQIIRQGKSSSADCIATLQKRVDALQSFRSTEHDAQRVMQANLHNLTISEQAYVDAVSTPEQLRSLRQVVVLDVYKQFSELYSTVQSVQAQLVDYKKQLSDSQDAVRLVSDENLKLRRAADLQQDEFVTEIESLQSRNKKLAEENAYLASILDDLQLKSRHIADLEGKSTHFEREYDRLAHQLSEFKLKHDKLAQENDRNAADSIEKEQANELLRLDKAYLEKDNDGLREKMTAAESEIQNLMRKTAEIAQQRDESFNRIENLRTEWKVQYEKRLDVELARLQESNGKELNLIRVHQKEAYEREIMGLKEYRDQLISEKDRALHKYDEVRSLYDQLRNESQACQSTLERQIQELRAQVKVKSFEFERLSIAYEQGIAQHRKLSQSLERVAEEGDLYKKQYYEIRGDSARIQAELMTGIENLKEKLQTYEALEKDLDTVITYADSENHHAMDGDNPPSSFVPTLPSRRIKHSIALAQRLLQKQKQLHSLKEELDNKTRVLQEKEKEISEYKHDLENVEQPYSFLIESIKKREQEITHAQAIIEQLYQQLSALQQENDALAQDKTTLEANVRSFLKRRSDISSESKQDDKVGTHLKKNQAKNLPSWCQKLVQHNRISQQINKA